MIGARADDMVFVHGCNAIKMDSGLPTLICRDDGYRVIAMCVGTGTDGGTRTDDLCAVDLVVAVSTFPAR